MYQGKKVVAIIAEFNHFHRGHAYLLEQARLLAKDGYVLVLMSGNYVQRGEPALIEKSLRAKMAILSGADLVFELPLFFSISDAGNFAQGAISMLSRLPFIDQLVYGCECKEPELLHELAEFFLHPDSNYRTLFEEYLKAGVSYPKARVLALKDLKTSPSFPIHLLDTPNNSLAMEYLIALKQYHSSIAPKGITRVKSFAQASKIRDSYLDIDLIQKEIPQEVKETYWNYFEHYHPVVSHDYTMYVNQCLALSHLGLFDFSGINRIPEDLSNRFRNNDHLTSIPQFLEDNKKKNDTCSSLARALYKSIFQITDKSMEAAYKEALYQVLAVSKKGVDLFSEIKKQNLPLMTKVAEFEQNILPTKSSEFVSNYHRKAYADELYRMILNTKKKKEAPLYPKELQKKFIII